LICCAGPQTPNEISFSRRGPHRPQPLQPRDAALLAPARPEQEAAEAVEAVEAAAAERVGRLPQQTMRLAERAVQLLRMPTPLMQRPAGAGLAAQQPALVETHQRPLLPTQRPALAAVTRQRRMRQEDEAEQRPAEVAEDVAAARPAEDVVDVAVMRPLRLLKPHRPLLKALSSQLCSAQTRWVICGLPKLPAIRCDSPIVSRSRTEPNASFSQRTVVWVHGMDYGNPTGLSPQMTISLRSSSCG